jgi:hypothetical protein
MPTPNLFSFSYPLDEIAPEIAPSKTTVTKYTTGNGIETFHHIYTNILFNIIRGSFSAGIGCV